MLQNSFASKMFPKIMLSRMCK